MRRDMRSAGEAVYEMIRGPGAGNLHLAVAHHGAGSGEFVLVTLHVLAIDQVSDVEDHFAGFGEAAAYFFIEGHEEPVHLKADGTGAGLTFALPGCRFAEIGQVTAAHFVGRKLSDQFASAAAVVDENLEVHLGFAAQFIDVAEELSLVGPDGFAEAFVVVEDGAKAERKNGGVFEAISDDSCVVHTRFLIQTVCRVMFADDNCEVTGWVKENLISAYSVH